MLKLYAKASGQCLNMEKSSVYFSSNTTSQIRESIKAMIRVNEVDRFESYLGLPTLVGRRKYHTFSFLKDRVWKKLQGWRGKIYLERGRKYLLKQWPNRFLRTLWEFFNCRLSYVKNSYQCVLGIGGDRLEMRGRFTG